jgi:hypothetical protein
MQREISARLITLIVNYAGCKGRQGKAVQCLSKVVCEAYMGRSGGGWRHGMVLARCVVLMMCFMSAPSAGIFSEIQFFEILNLKFFLLLFFSQKQRKEFRMRIPINRDASPITLSNS